MLYTFMLKFHILLYYMYLSNNTKMQKHHVTNERVGPIGQNIKVTEDRYPFQVFTPFSHHRMKLMRLETPLLGGGQLRQHKYRRKLY